MKIEYENSSKENWFLITWDLSNKCNYRCSYCPSDFHNGSSGWPNIDEVKQFIESVNNQTSKNICFRVSGGEPTFWKYFTDFAQTAKEHNNTFSFLSNGSRPIDYWKTIAPYTDGLMLSFHPEFSDPMHFAEIANVMHCPVVVNLMLVPDKFDEMLDIAKIIYENSNAAIWPKIVLDKVDFKNNVVGYTDKQKDIIKNWPYFRKVDDIDMHRGNILYNGKVITANDLMLNGLNKHRGWTCYAGVDTINVDFWGNIYKANCEQGGKIGDIKNFILASSPIICNKDACTCLSDIYLRKEKISSI